MASPGCVVRRATTADIGSVQKFYSGGDGADIRSRLDRPSPGTAHYLVELTGEPAALFSLTELGRLRPGVERRLLLHDMRIRPQFRGTGVAEDLFGWLSHSLGAGREIELLAFAPPEYEPPIMAQFGLHDAHHAYKWPVPPKEA